MLYSLKFILPFFLFCTQFFFSVSAQKRNKQEVIYNGEIELRNSTVKVGNFSIDYERDIVRYYNEEGTIDTYSAFSLVSIMFHDEHILTPRVFVSLNISPKNERNGYFLYEIVKVGEMDILRRANKNIDLSSIAYLPFGERTFEYDKKFEYFIFFDSNLFPLRSFQKSLLPVIKSEMQETFNDFVKARGINLNDKLQPLILIEYFNAIQRPQLVKAFAD